MRSVRCEPAYILHSRPYRDSSLILEAFSESHGRMGMVARGARAPRSRQRALLQPFQPLLLSWSGGGEMATLTAAEGMAGMIPLQGNGLFSGFYVNELMVRLLHRNDPHPELFACYAQLLSQLAGPDNLEVPLRIFEIQLLEWLGYGLQLGHDAESGEPLQAQWVYDYQLDRGPVRWHGEPERGVKLSGGSLLAMALHDFSQPLVRREAKRLTRVILDQLLGHRPLKTREVLQQMSQKVHPGKG